MHRVGALPQTALDIARYLDASELLELGGVWTHFASAEWDRDFTAVQTQRFHDFVTLLVEEDIDPGLLHCANTAGALFSPEARMDMVRVGLGVYGLQPSQESQPVALRPVMRVVSEVSHVARYSAGERLSYGRTKPLLSDAWVATVPIGYADGYERRLGEQGVALIGGVRCAFAGTVTMDQILLIADKKPSVGDEVVLLGLQDDDEITAEEWAQWLGTINYEVVCGMGSRLPRRFIKSQVQGSV